MTLTNEINKADMRKLNAIKKELLTNKNATTSSHTACNNRLKELADKYNVSTQVMYDSATYKNEP